MMDSGPLQGVSVGTVFPALHQAPLISLSADGEAGPLGGSASPVQLGLEMDGGHPQPPNRTA